MGGQTVGSGPAAFTPLNRTEYAPYEVTGTRFHSWRGEVSPGGAYEGEFGTSVRVAARVTSPQPFTLGKVRVGFEGSDCEARPVSLDGAGIAPPGTLAGLSFGADGARGGGGDDDTFYSATSLSAAVQINALYFVGPGQVNGFCSAEEAKALGGPEGVCADSNAYDAAHAPYRFAITVSLRDGALEMASNTFNGSGMPVPEPASWALMLVGLGAAELGYRRRRHRGF